MMKLFNLLLSPIGRVASRPMRNIETFPSKQMYLYLSLFFLSLFFHFSIFGEVREPPPKKS